MGDGGKNFIINGKIDVLALCEGERMQHAERLVSDHLLLMKIAEVQSDPSFVCCS